jgi:hypothetical protein
VINSHEGAALHQTFIVIIPVVQVEQTVVAAGQLAVGGGAFAGFGDSLALGLFLAQEVLQKGGGGRDVAGDFAMGARGVGGHGEVGRSVVG